MVWTIESVMKVFVVLNCKPLAQRTLDGVVIAAISGAFGRLPASIGKRSKNSSQHITLDYHGKTRSERRCGKSEQGQN